ncbi:DinB family protein [Streptomyces sp. NPDC052682]|uniref:DinB family protein n=1 Tax=Streptomyces sp. NPDC052682 TaxID=3154954 RepID=UPI00342DDD6B
MIESDAKADLLRSLQEARDALVWKLEGLSEYDMRRPLTPTGTNLLGLVKHLAGVEMGYFGDTFARPFPGQPPSWEQVDDDPYADMWATADESSAEITRLYRRVWRHSDATIADLPLDAAGRVPWWPEERSEVTLHQVLVRVLGDTQRHAGHADIVRELIDGSAGLLAGRTSLPSDDEASWAEHRGRVEQAARQAGGTADE